MTYSKEDYLYFKLLLGNNMYNAYFNGCRQENIDKMLTLVVLIYDTKGLNLIKQYLNILALFDDQAKRELIIQPTMLIKIDDNLKEVAWILSITNYDLEKFCKKLENEL